MNKMRVLYYVPMVHTQQELGSLKDATTKASKEKYRGQQIEEFFKQIERYWEEVERRVQQAGLYQPELASRLHIFVDSLPNAKEEIVQKIVQDLIGQNIPVYQIIEKFQKVGAKVYGAENSKLLEEEYKYWQEVVSKNQKADATFAQRLLEERDKAIARRIDEVLREGEIGILFIGKAHNIIGELTRLTTKEFKIIYL